VAAAAKAPPTATTHARTHAQRQAMERAKWQMLRLTVRYCDFGGSSRGAREWIKTRLPQFATENPHLACRTILGRGKHPAMQGEYLRGVPRTCDLKNKTPREIERLVQALRDTNGHKVGSRGRQH
jgi:large subunit ribosomal protein L43